MKQIEYDAKHSIHKEFIIHKMKAYYPRLKSYGIIKDPQWLEKPDGTGTIVGLLGNDY